MKGTFSLGGGVTCDLERLVTTRLLVQANSGGGKSWLLRRLLEQTAGSIQHLVIDPEGEFSTLRERFDYVLAAKSGGDTAADPRTAALLAERLLELRVSAILDIYELDAHARVLFVRRFLEGLIDAPKALWHPVLVVVDEAHVYCLDRDTELLTSDGWVKQHAIHTGLRAVGFNLATGETRYEPVQAVIRKHFSGKLVHLKSDGIDCRVTPEHRVVLRRGQRAKGRTKKYPWQFELADRVPNHVDIPIGTAPTSCGAGIGLDVFRVIGWMATDGHLTRHGVITISQAVTTTKAGRNIVAEMDVVLKRLDCRSRYERKRAGKADSVEYYLGPTLSSRLLAWFPDRNIHRVPRPLIEDSSSEELAALYQGLLEGDGTATSRGWRAFYPGKNEGLADDFQEIATKLGISTVKKLVPQTGQWTVLISKRTHHYIRKPSEVEYDDLVWCVTVPSGAFVARRNGKVFVTGNCPETGHAESADAVKALATRGRKRGFCAVFATQRLSKFSKDAAAECNNKLIGRTSLDVDMSRAGDELGMTKGDRALLRDMAAGEFYAFGPAFVGTLSGINRVHVGRVATTHPEAGGRLAVTPPPPTAHVKALLPKLSDLPAEAEQRERSMADLKKQIADLKTQLARKVDPTCTQVTKVVEKAVLKDGQLARAEKLIDRCERLAETFGKLVELPLKKIFEDVAGVEEDFRTTAKEIRDAIASTRNTHANEQAAVAQPRRAPVMPTQGRRVTPAPVTSRPASLVSLNGSLPPGEAAVLTAALQYPSLDRKRLGILTGYKRSSRDAYILRLVAKGLLEVAGNALHATEAGAAAMPNYEPLPTGEALIAHWRERLPEGERKTLDVLIQSSGKDTEREVIDQQTGYKRSSRDAYLLRLKARGLVEFSGRGLVRASEELFA